MKNEHHLRLEKNYLIASAAAVFTAFLCINLYPEHHGGPQIGRSGLLALSAAMIAMLIFIVYKVRGAQKENSTENEETPASDPSRLKRMFFLWSICTVLLAVSLVRYPLYLHFKMGETLSTRSIFGLISGVGLILATLIHVLARLKDYRKL